MKTLVSRNIAMCLLLILVVACGEKEDKDISPDTTAAASCILTQVIDDNEEGYKFEYNNAGYVTKFTETEDNNVSTTTFIYDANNYLIKEENQKNGELANYSTYEYSNNLVTSSTFYNLEEGTQYTETYKYDASNRKVEETDNVDYRYVYTYDAKSNVTKIETYYKNLLSYRQTFENYDDKSTYFSTLKGLPAGYFDSSKNNPGKTTYSVDLDGNGTIDAASTQVTDYSYKYNSNGLPTEITEISGADKYTTSFTYECK